MSVITPAPTPTPAIWAVDSPECGERLAETPTGLAVGSDLRDVEGKDDWLVSSGLVGVVTRSVLLERGAVGGGIWGTPLAMTMLVTSWVVEGLPIVDGRAVAIVGEVVAGSRVAVITLKVFGTAPGTLSQTLYTPTRNRSFPVQRETRH